MESEKQVEIQCLHTPVEGAKPCVVCGIRLARSKRAKYCDECFTGSKPSSVEYAVFKAVREGRLKPIRECTCVDCGAPARHYDHRDYNKPEEVEPVCVSCNWWRGPAIRYRLPAGIHEEEKG